MEKYQNKDGSMNLKAIDDLCNDIDRKFGNKERKTFYCNTKCLATYLVECGFEYFKKDINRYQDNKLIYFFDDTPELREAVSKYKTHKTEVLHP